MDFYGMYVCAVIYVASVFCLTFLGEKHEWVIKNFYLNNCFKKYSYERSRPKSGMELFWGIFFSPLVVLLEMIFWIIIACVFLLAMGALWISSSLD